MPRLCELLRKSTNLQYLYLASKHKRFVCERVCIATLYHDDSIWVRSPRCCADNNLAQGATELAEALASCLQLRHLDMTGRLAAATTFTRRLALAARIDIDWHLGVAGNAISADGATALAATLAKLRWLQVLVLDGTVPAYTVLAVQY